MTFCQLSPRGQVTLPAEARRALGLRGGDALDVIVDGGRIILQPVVTLPARIYTDADLAMFADASAMTDDELSVASDNWHRGTADR